MVLFLFQKQHHWVVLLPPPSKYLHSYLLNPGSNVVSLGEHLTQAAEMWYNSIIDNQEKGDTHGKEKEEPHKKRVA